MAKKRGLNLPKERTFLGPALVWKRMLAFLADLLIVNLTIIFPFRRVIEKAMPKFSSYSEAYNFVVSNESYTAMLTFASLVISVLVILYFVLLERKVQQTPGKMLFNIYVLSDNEKATFWQFFARSLFIIPVFPFFLLWVIDPMFMFFTKTNQRLSEVLSKTRTVERYLIG